MTTQKKVCLVMPEEGFKKAKKRALSQERTFSSHIRFLLAQDLKEAKK